MSGTGGLGLGRWGLQGEVELRQIIGRGLWVLPLLFFLPYKKLRKVGVVVKEWLRKKRRIRHSGAGL